MAILELVHPRPDWKSALGQALSRPPGMPERRTGGRESSGEERAGERRRVSDDLAWLREAVEEPGGHGLREVEGTSAVAVWEAPPDEEHTGRLCRLRDRGVLEAAGFLLHEGEGGRF
jgi:hypothetical protein